MLQHIFIRAGLLDCRFHCRGSKEQHLRIWKDYQPSTTAAIPKEAKNFTGKVIEIVNADALVVKLADGSLKKIHFSSLRPPR